MQAKPLSHMQVRHTQDGASPKGMKAPRKSEARVKTDPRKQTLPELKCRRRTSVKTDVFFSFFILVGRRGPAGSCGRLLGGGRATSRVTTFFKAAQDAKERVGLTRR